MDVIDTLETFVIVLIGMVVIIIIVSAAVALLKNSKFLDTLKKKFMWSSVLRSQI